MFERVLRAGYGALWWFMTPFLLLHLCWRARLQPEYLAHVGERFGRYVHRESPRSLIWIHAVSVGETRAAEPLLAALVRRFPQAEFLISHTTPTGRAVALPAQWPLQRVYLPYDYRFATRRFLRTYRPSLAIFMETEVWPNLVAQCATHGVPMALVNARLSERSARRAQRLRALIGPALARVQLVLAQTEADARRLGRLGARAPRVVGNLKFDMVVPEAQWLLAATFRRWWRDRKVFLAASTREGEERLLLEAWCAIDAPDDALLMLVPRHPQRIEEVARLIFACGLRMARRSQARVVDATCQVVLGDSMGEMLAYYASATVAYVGGSLLPFGSHNLIEPCAVGCPILLGPSTFNFAQAASDALAIGAARSVHNAEHAVALAREIMADGQQRMRMSQAGLEFAQTHRGAAARTVSALETLLEV